MVYSVTECFSQSCFKLFCWTLAVSHKYTYTVINGMSVGVRLGRTWLKSTSRRHRTSRLHGGQTQSSSVYAVYRQSDFTFCRGKMHSWEGHIWRMGENWDGDMCAHFDISRYMLSAVGKFRVQYRVTHRSVWPPAGITAVVRLRKDVRLYIQMETVKIPATRWQINGSIHENKTSSAS